MQAEPSLGIRELAVDSCFAVASITLLTSKCSVVPLLAIVLSIRATRHQRRRIFALNLPYRTSNSALALPFLLSLAIQIFFFLSVAFICFQLRYPMNFDFQQEQRFKRRIRKLTVSFVCILFLAFLVLFEKIIWFLANENCQKERTKKSGNHFSRSVDANDGRSRFSVHRSPFSPFSDNDLPLLRSELNTHQHH